ncbi:hypothetical protein Taro_055316 [Colocasia esculenta]|uniref:Uncharacterized protein n=1 Tax=Colocasia esculenta TaxID=4460 RepID=A0A843XSK5_COLES|nr:hypothetical protein [Colocasia esculenta]
MSSGGWDIRPSPLGPCGPILRVATCSLVTTWSQQGGRPDKGWVATTKAVAFLSRRYGHHVVVATSDGIVTDLLTDVTGVLSVRTALSGVRRTRVNATWSPVAIAFLVFEAFVLRWCRPACAGDVAVSFGERRRCPFLREGPNGFVLHVEAWDTEDNRSSTQCRLAKRETLVFLVQAESPLFVFASRVVVTTSSRPELPTVCETSQQRQGVRQAEETGW